MDKAVLACQFEATLEINSVVRLQSREEGQKSSGVNHVKTWNIPRKLLGESCVNFSDLLLFNPPVRLSIMTTAVIAGMTNIKHESNMSWIKKTRHGYYKMPLARA